MFKRFKRIANVRVFNYDLYTEKDCNARIAMIPDFHDASEKRVKAVFKELNKLKPDAIVIQGDIMQAKKYGLGSDTQKRLKKTLNDASKICDIFLGLGNHDLYGMNDELMEGYLDLGSDNPKVHALNNESFLFEKLNIRFSELHTSHDSYAPSKQTRGNALLLFSEESDKLKSIEPSDDENVLNLLIYHNPKVIALAISIATHMWFCIEQEKLDELAKISKTLDKFDCILSSHLHGGYFSIKKLVNYVLDNPGKVADLGIWEMPKRENIRGKLRLLNPLFFAKTPLCRGLQYISSDKNVSNRIIEMPREDLSKAPQYLIARDLLSTRKKNYKLMNTNDALEEIASPSRTPICIAGAVNPLFNLPIGVPEITMLNIQSKKKKR